MTGFPRSRPIPLLVLMFAIVACNPAPSPPNESAESAPVPPPATAAAPSSTPAAGQTDTEWGRIWDRLPDGFPIHPGAAPAEDMATDVVSASYAVEGVDAQAVVDWMRGRLEDALFATEGRNGPLEDGGFVLDSVGVAGCRIQVRATPMGGLVNLTIRYEASCPAP